MASARPGLARLGVFAGVFLASAAFQLPFFDRWFSAMDEGHVLLFSEMVARGGTLYRDATLYPLPGAFYLLALLFRLFEPSMLVARWTVLIEFALFVAVVHDLLRRAVPARLALAVVPLLWAWRVWCFPHWQMYSYSTTALLLLAVSLRLLLSHLESGRRGALVASGLVFGLGVFCKQDYGAAALLASLLLLAVAARTRPAGSSAPRFLPALAGFLLPASAVGLLAALHFALRGVLPDVIRFCVLNHFTGMSDFEYWSFPPLLPLFTQDPALRAGAGLASHFPSLVWMVDYQGVRSSWLYRETPLYELYVKALVYGPWLVLASGALRLGWTRARFSDPARRGPALAECALLATAAAFTLLVHWVKPQDSVHLSVTLWPFYALALIYGHALWQARRRLAWATAALAVPAALAALAYTGHLAWELREAHPAEIPLARARGIFVRPAEARLLADLVHTIQAKTRPGESIGVFPYFPILHFLADRPGPHRTGYIVWPYAEIEGRDRAIIDAMEQQHTRLVIYHFTQFLTLPRMREYAPDLYAYLVDHFEMTQSYSADRLGYKLAALLREEGPPPGRPLLAGIADGELRVDRGGTRRVVPLSRRDDFARIESWPFRPTLALRPSVGARTTFSVPLHAKRGERLRTAIGTNPEKWFGYPPCAVSFRIDAVAGDRRETLYARTIDPQRKLEDRGWFEVDLPLDAYAGRDAVLEFSTAAERPSGRTLLSAGFALPRLVPAESGLRATTR